MRPRTGVWRKFACGSCGEQFYIVRRNPSSGDWVRYMPPRFCPKCGCEVDEENECRDKEPAWL